MMKLSFPFVLILIGCMFYGCTSTSADEAKNASNEQQQLPESTLQFWQNLTALCGQSFEGKLVAGGGGASDTTFTNNRMVMHVKACEPNRIRIPFTIGNNRSRTWVLTLTDTGILLKHDHRHADGTSDDVTMYGGHTTNAGTATRQLFPADQETLEVVPGAVSNVWWIDVVPGEQFTYNLRRVTTDRVISIQFDLATPVATPESPWGWEDGAM